mmetsp:Transcript_68844/g.212909  ORF Transcript_68844/g.212909 Transcript_68844/m.212909 type:complete len:247 (+) Transcript_68844:89-829(+)
MAASAASEEDLSRACDFSASCDWAAPRMCRISVRCDCNIASTLLRTCCWCKCNASLALRLFCIERTANKVATVSPLSAEPRSFRRPCTSSLISMVPLQLASKVSKRASRLARGMSRLSSMCCTSGFSRALLNTSWVSCKLRLALSFLTPLSCIVSSRSTRFVKYDLWRCIQSENVRPMDGGSCSKSAPVQNMIMTSCNFCAKSICSACLSTTRLASKRFACSKVLSTITAMMRLKSPKITKDKVSM